MKKILIPFCAIILFACGNNSTQKTENQSVATVQVPAFNADSAYFFVKKQVDFGARVPETSAHKLCADYLKNKLEEYGATADFHLAKGTLYNGQSVDIKNIIGNFNPQAKQRILLCAHWDSRPFADNESDEAKWHTPVLGANDGASGVGVLLEVARNLKSLSAEIGVDIVFFDVEDYGAPQFYQGRHTADSWCIGSREWAKSAKAADYQAQFGILLDMVGAPSAKFYKEVESVRYAANVVEKVWNTAANLGFDGYFVAKRGGQLIDDHLSINQIANIPCIDIIQFDENSPHNFGAYWHTTTDDMRNIDRNTLYAVGSTVLNMVFLH
ncbi:MAG: M28 family peptidase [Prevotellaceae bacterium]|jgi:Zn-dependent M28 family amino/carboxypeptidase|nr:M28 family peptidase [Prevotellaceae bacterium]